MMQPIRQIRLHRKNEESHWRNKDSWSILIMTLGRSSLPIEIQKLIIAFSSLPGIGPKTAQRLTFYILSQSVDETLKLSEALKDVKKT